ncbi:hypothetical protein G9400_17610 [Klebsiella michiganensis]|nr:hypothetical protein [Klebsiella michiganensis]
MEKKYIEYLHAAQTVQNDSERLSFLTSTLRSLLQTAVISSFEIAKNLTPSDEHDLIELTNRFCKPSDGLPLQILDTLTPVIRSYIANDYLHGWFESTKLIEKPLSKQLIEWVEFRNKRTGHGVLDEKNKQRMGKQNRRHY